MKLLTCPSLKDIVVFVSVFFTINCFSQQEVKQYDTFNDTLLIISDFILDKDKMLVERQFLIDSDSIKINQKGLFLESFTMSAISLGQTISLGSKNPYFSEAMRTEIINEQNRFKFIYLKNIILRTKDGRKLSPSTQNIKIIFIN